MSYDAFKARVNALIERAGEDISVKFRNDSNNGKYFANCSNGVTIIGNAKNIKIQVRWGSGHVAMSELC